MIEVVGCSEVYDVKFYPYGKPTDDPIFAAVGGKQLIVCRLTHARDGRVETIRSVIDESPSTDDCSIAWAQAEDGCPLMCIGGSTGLIKIINLFTCELILVLSGHGGDFHANGRYILSAGQDHVVNLWAVPKFPGDNTLIEKSEAIHYPHFSTSEVHSNGVDCVKFYKDLVLSSGTEEGYIVLWQIAGFSSSAEVLPPSAAPTTYNQSARTRSAFFKVPEGDETAPRQYKRLLQFAVPQSNQWFMRFGLYTPCSSSKHPVLAKCNSTSKVHFWDISRLVDYQKFITSPETVPKPSWLSLKSQTKKVGKSDWHGLLNQNPVGESVASSSVSSFSTETLASAIDIEANRSQWDEKYATGNPWKSLKAHKIESIPRVTTVGRAVAWSNDGDFCVVVGSSDMGVNRDADGSITIRKDRGSLRYVEVAVLSESGLNFHQERNQGHLELSEENLPQKGHKPPVFDSHCASSSATSHQTMASSANPYQNYSHPQASDHDEDLIDPDTASLDDLDDPLDDAPNYSARAPLTGNIGSSSSSRPLNESYLTSAMPGDDRRAPTNTIDESVWDTLSRDLLAVWSKMREVLYPKYLFGGSMIDNTTTLRGAYEGFRAGGIAGAREEVRNIAGRVMDTENLLSQGNMSQGLRDWDLWGPLVFCLALSLLLSFNARPEQKSVVFSGVFAMIWIGEAVVTAQIKLLGGNISFAQSVCIIGYTLFPLVIAALLSALHLPTIPRIPVYIVLIGWSLAAGVSIMGGSGVVKNRVGIAVYPLFREEVW
ncbi:hypothetical protein V493_02200 [Pseudogymnoascus sp. VKM F-4281 (FW-2241)]|nr:hypothetical protein V493_02200 [Pseudogymnoascus sp. VKM F-4281 (FW-2241)]